MTVALLALGFTTQRGRGRAATTPSEVPPRGWKDILFRIWQNIGKDRVIVVAAGVTFYAVLALFPAIAALVALYGLFADPSTITSHLDSIAGLVPAGAIEVIRDQITRVASQGGATLGLTFLVGLLASLWSANAGIKSLFDALNLVYNETEKRSFVWLNVISLTFTVLAIAFVLVAIGAIVVVPTVLNFLGLAGATAMLVKIARWPALEAAGGRSLRTAGGKVVHLEGAASPKRVGIVEWDSLEQAEAFYKSKAYNDLAPQRDKANARAGIHRG